MVLKTSFRPVFLLGAFALSVAPATAQDAKAVIQKMGELYSKAKTYQATFTAEMTMGNQTLKSTTFLKKQGEKQSIRTNSQGMPGTPPGGRNSQMLNDGKFIYIYMPTTNQYIKTASNNATRQGMMQGVGGMSPDILARELTKDPNTTMKMLPATNVGGQAVFALELGSTKLQNQKAYLYIEKATYHLKQMRMDMGQMKVTLNVRDEKLNAPIPASEFVFTPPKGATEMKAAPGMGGGMGAPPGGPARKP